MDKNSLNRLISFEDEGVDSSTGFVSAGGSVKNTMTGLYNRLQRTLPSLYEQCRDMVCDFIEEIYENEEIRYGCYSLSCRIKPLFITYKTSRGGFNSAEVYGLRYGDSGVKGYGKCVYIIPMKGKTNIPADMVDDIEWLKIFEFVISEDAQRTNGIQIK